MKKLISVLVSVTLFITILPQVIFASTPSSDGISESTVLFELGVTDFEKPADMPVTRAAFTRYAMKLADIPVTPHVGTAFDDVTEAHPDYNFIMSAVDFGLISRATSYRPDDYVTINEAAKIMIILLGYDYMAEAKGGYPYGYLQTAKAVDLMNGVTIAEGVLSQENASIILCNALHINLPEVTYTAEGASGYRRGSATILSQYRNMEYVTGIVDGNSKYSVNDESGLGDGKMSVDGVVYNCGKVDATNLFGYEVDAYIDLDNKTVVSCHPTQKNKLLTIYAEDVTSYKSRKFIYEDETGKEKYASIAPDAYVFLNGKLFDFDSSKLIPDSGSLTFISQGSGAATTVHIKSYKTTVVDRISNSDYILADKYSRDNNLVLNPDKTEYTITTQDGAAMEFDSIVIGDVLCSAVSDDGSLAEVICVRDRIMGTYSGYSQNYIQIDGASYRLSASLKGMVDDIISLGKEATFSLDLDHRVADISPVDAAGEEVGYLFWGRYQEKGLSQNMYARILSLDGSKAMYTFADTFSINGNVYKDCELAYNAHKSPDYNSLLCGMVKFKLDEEGKLKSLTYSDKEGGNGGLYVTQTVEEADEYHTYQQWFNNVGIDIICDTSLKIFKVPNPLYSVDKIDEDNYTVEPPTIIDSNYAAQGYKLVGYTTNPDDGLSKYLLMQKIEDDFTSGDVDLSSKYPYMVSSIKKVLYKDDPREALEVCGMHGTYTIYSYGESDFSDAGVEGGDIIRFEATENDVIKSSKAFEIIYKKGTNVLTNGSYYMSSGGRVTQAHIRLDFINEFRKDVAYAVSLSNNPATVLPGDGTPIYMPNVTIYKYDNKLKRIVEMSVNDIKDYKNFGNDKSSVIYCRTYYSMTTMFIVGE